MAKRKKRVTRGERRVGPKWRRAPVAMAIVAALLMTSAVLAWRSARSGPAIPAAVQGLPPPSSPSKEFIYAGGRLIATEEEPGGGDPPGAPTGLVATAGSASSVTVTWTGPTPAPDYYEIERATVIGQWSAINSNWPSSPYTDTPVVGSVTYLYRVRAWDEGVPSAYSNVDLATTIIFDEDPLPPVPPSTTIKAPHVSQLRTAVNAVRAAAGLGAASWFEDPLQPQVTTIKAQHITQLRSALDPARAAIGVSSISYSQPTLTPGVTLVKAADVQELREGVK